MRALLLCDGAPRPTGISADASLIQKSIDWRSTSPDLNLRIQNLWDAVLDEVDGRAADLVRIAAFVYAADQEISRGGPTDIYGRDWHRELHLAIPVADLTFWSEESVRTQLEVTLQFLTGDTWRFWFSQFHGGRSQLSWQPGDRQLLRDPDCVVLFSGGADSLCAAVELIVNEGMRPLLVSHWSSPPLHNHQRRLVEHLSERAPGHRPAHIGFWVYRLGSDPADASQRSRGFLFASLGAALAGQLGISRVVLPDNGVVSVNLPINAQFVGALSSRSTHPKFIWLFNRLVASVFQTQVHVENTLALRTRPEVLSILRTTGWEDLLSDTHSCSHPHGRTKEQPHCGDCSQCVDRRFGTIDAGLEEFDPVQRYKRDIFTHALPEGEPLTISESYVRFARWVRTQAPEQLFLALPELGDVIVPDCPNVPEVAQAYGEMFQRHGESVVRVLSRMIGQNQDSLAAGHLPETSLLRLASAGARRAAVGSTQDNATSLPANLFRLAGTVRHIHFEGYETWVEDTVGTRQLARLLVMPGREIDVMDLVERRFSNRGRLVSREQGDLAKTGDSPQEILDDETRINYRARLLELSAEREAAEREGRQIELDRIQTEYEQIEHELAAAEGLRGRPRRFTRDQEKARQSVRRSIKLAMQSIAAVHPALGRHLDITVATGFFCVYRPEHPATWVT